MMAAVWIIAAVAGVFLLQTASQLLIPIVLAILISYALEPVVAWLHKRRVPRMAGAGLLLALILGFSGWGAYNLREDALQAIETLPEVARRARELVWAQGGSGPAERIRQAAEELRRSPQDEKSDAPTGNASVQQQKPSDGSTTVEWVQRGVGSIVALAGHITVVCFLVFFLLISGSHFKRRIIEVAGPHLERRRITAIVSERDLRVASIQLATYVEQQGSAS
jgi:predicted PurR-regulated permease PerM